MPAPAFLIPCACRSEADTAALSAAIARMATPGDLLILEGALAAGKTHFIKYMCDALQIEDTVTSPTFTLAHFYAGPVMPILHVDAYRIETPHEFSDMTLHDFLDDHLTAIEWGGNFKDVLPPALHIEIAPVASADTARQIILSSDAPSWIKRADNLRAAAKNIAPKSVTPCA